MCIRDSYCIVPNPEYDCDCGLSILAAIWLLQRSAPAQGWRNGFAAGAGACLPLFFKQNMGLPFLLAVLGAAVVLLALRSIPGAKTDSAKCDASTLAALLAGAGSALLAAALLLHFTAGIGNYIDWTIRFAAQRRLPGLSDMIGIYRDPGLLLALPCVAVALVLLRSRFRNARWAHIAAFALLAAPFVFTLGSLLLYDDADERGDSPVSYTHLSEAAMRFRSHSNGPRMASSKSLMSNTSRPSRPAYAPRLRTCASPHSWLTMPVLGLTARSAAITGAAPRK